MDAQARIMDEFGTPEGVAYRLMMTIAEAEKPLKDPPKTPPRDYYLNLYAECLEVVTNVRNVRQTTPCLSCVR